MQIERLTVAQTQECIAELSALLEDAVASGASLGFLPPLAPGESVQYWHDVIAALSSPFRILLVARDEGYIVGAVQLDYAARPNASHRAEVLKLMVDRAARGRGIGAALMEAAEQDAKRDSRTLLVLDTRSGDPSERLYRRLGYEAAGTIPAYARSASGALHTTVIMYKHLI